MPCPDTVPSGDAIAEECLGIQAYYLTVIVKKKPQNIHIYGQGSHPGKPVLGSSFEHILV